MRNIPETFGSLVFDDRVMKSMLSAEVYQSLKQTIDEGAKLNLNVANAVAQAMKQWAVSKGATHYTHWFQPLTGITAEKHESFISPSPDGGVIMDFSGKELVKGEPDASSFPSGGLRATFEARGYTAWDPTSYAFIKDNTLCIPTAFCAYSGEALDKKTPLLRSMEALSRQAVRVLHLFGNDGAEQEYFLIPQALYDQRADLRFTGRTLFGAKPPKGQEMDDHYFGVIPQEVAAFMEDLNEQLWLRGIFAKTEHNEVAPAQHELACIYTTVNLATDQNQLVMELMRKTAAKHGLVCLLHEKPFAGVNGSGKHNNWSMATDEGANLLSPGATPYENAQFLLFLCAVIQAVDDYQDLLRISVASASNDHRLGANEAPPAVVSIFLGDELTGVLDAIESGVPYEKHAEVLMKLGAAVLPRFSRDNTDRNRTSPFAFTGNKFEFRMLGSSNSIAGANIMLNSAVAESLRQYADELEGADDFGAALNELLRRTIREHKRIIFNGNGYDAAWLDEAAKRGLLNYKTTADCVPHLLDEKNSKMLCGHGVFTQAELASRCEIMLENYSKTVRIEAETMTYMAKRQLLPAVTTYAAAVADSIRAKRALDSQIVCKQEETRFQTLCALAEAIGEEVQHLEENCELHSADAQKDAEAMRDCILPTMEKLRAHCDAAEELTASEYWPIPDYAELLYGVK